MDYKKELVKYAHLIEEKGYVNAAEGNISILDRENRKLYITPSGKRKLFLTEDDISVLDFDSEEQLAGLKASSEYRLHKAALAFRRDCNAVVHSHCTFLTAFAMMNKNCVINSHTTFIGCTRGEIKCLPYGEPGTLDIANGLEDAICDRPLALLGNHGVIGVGESVEVAFKILEAVEETAKTYFVSKLLGEPIDVPEKDKLIEKFFG